MKYLLCAVVAVAVYFWLAHRSATHDPAPAPATAAGASQASGASTPVSSPASSSAPSAQATPAAAAQPSSNVLKRPLDKTRQTLDKVDKRNGNGEF